MSNDTNAVKAEQELLDLESRINQGLPTEGDASTPVEGESESKPTEDTTSESESAPDKPNTSTDEEPKGDTSAKGKTKDLDDDEDLSQLSERAQKRIRDLREKVKSYEEKELEAKRNELLKKPIARQTEKDQGLEKGGKLPWNNPDQEITIEEYQADVQKAASTIVERKFKEKEMLDNLRSDAAEVEDLYPELNPDSESYDDELAIDISRDFRVIHQTNPELRLKDYVASRMKYKEKWSSQGKADVTAKVVKEHASQAITPTAMKKSAGGTSIEDKIKNAKSVKELEELEAQINAASK